MPTLITEYATCPPRIFLTLAEMAEGNDRLRRYWKTKYMRVSYALNKEAQR